MVSGGTGGWGYPQAQFSYLHASHHTRLPSSGSGLTSQSGSVTPPGGLNMIKVKKFSIIHQK